ncbi:MULTISPECIES: NAD(P)-dependent oxidoreductase [Streptomyces]|uniref:Epimerase n=1 Tax=Streptomyces globisporus C-1027 TaxID=1172567 RepID=A0A0U2T134_STRGL|nr:MULTISPECIES: NAD(P)H-binding protein [Streptomyces]ALU95616.1 epimerase [Streptomyces globisporus C-1027]OKJ30183.1 epimerase [Streptomyces sp. CB02130]
MKITVFGATGGVGQEITGQAIEAGHEVTVVARDPDRLPEALDRAVLHGVVRLDDEAAVRAAVAGRDAVLSGLGARGRKANGVAERLTGRIVSAMAAEGTRRLLAVSAVPVGPKAVGDPLTDRLSLTLVRAVFGDLYADLARMEAVLAGSATDWTAVRPPRLTDGPRTGAYRKAVGGTPRSSRTISRADVAHAMLALIDDPAAVKQGVGIAY